MKNSLIKDNKARTTAYFFKKEGIVFNNKFIKFLERYYTKEKKDIRICLHTNTKAKHHDMVILQQKKNFYEPHKHLKKGETYHIIKGSMACVLFSNNGKIKKICKLNKNHIFRTPVNIFHTMLPISNIVIYHESKTGPFLKKNDSIFSNWTKKLTKDIKHVEAFKKEVYKKIS